MQSRFKKYGLLRQYKRKLQLYYKDLRRGFKELSPLYDGISPRIIDEVLSVTGHNAPFDIHEWRLGIESVKEQIKLLEIDLKRYAVSIVSPFIKVLTLIQIKAKARLKQLKTLIQSIPDTPPKLSIDTQIINC